MMFPSLMEKEAVRFSGFARTLGSPGPVRETYWPISEHSVVFRVFLFWFYFFKQMFQSVELGEIF